MEFLSGLFLGWRMIDAAEAFEAAPTNPTAAFYRNVALYFFLTGAFLLLAAALVDTLANNRTAYEVIGWPGIGCAQVSLFCGLRYATVNKRDESDATQSF
jgi:hypothetical protein